MVKIKLTAGAKRRFSRVIGFATRAVLISGLVIGAMVTSDAGQPERSGDVLQALAESDAVLVSDTGQAVAAFEQRLRQRVTARDGVILVTDIPELSNVEAFPATVPWSISCGRYFGLSVSFGSGTTHDSGIIEVELSRAAITEDRCRQLLPPLGQKIEALLH